MQRFWDTTQKTHPLIKILGSLTVFLLMTGLYIYGMVLLSIDHIQVKQIVIITILYVIVGIPWVIYAGYVGKNYRRYYNVYNPGYKEII